MSERGGDSDLLMLGGNGLSDPTQGPRPFTLIVAGRSMLLVDAPTEHDGAVVFIDRTTITGDATWTDQGRDVQFTDMEADM